MSGFNLPPGCGTLPGEEDDDWCIVCHNDLDHCVCPRCPECDEIGNPSCYIEDYLNKNYVGGCHALKMTDEQKRVRAENEKEMEQNAQKESEYMESLKNLTIFDE